tara:strand:- start:1094 stop:1660 length:567 start_codon:yes stop_codon:yes gene_type:complete
MTIKMIFLSFLITGAYATAAFANCDHKHKEDANKKEHSEHGGKEGHHSKKEAGHGVHEHSGEGSPVGQPAAGSKATKTIHVTTLDTMRYKFASMPNLTSGDIVKFVVTNNGQIAHEFSIGDEEEQMVHRKMMREMPNMVHEDGNTITIKPGVSKELTWQFKGGREVVFACNIPGHYEAGMFKRIVLTK